MDALIHTLAGYAVFGVPILALAYIVYRGMIDIGTHYHHLMPTICRYCETSEYRDFVAYQDKDCHYDARVFGCGCCVHARGRQIIVDACLPLK